MSKCSTQVVCSPLIDPDFQRICNLLMGVWLGCLLVLPVVQIQGDLDTHQFTDASLTVRYTKLKPPSSVAVMGASPLLYPYGDDNESFYMASYLQYKRNSRGARGSSSMDGNMLKHYKLSWAKHYKFSWKITTREVCIHISLSSSQKPCFKNGWSIQQKIWKTFDSSF